MTLQAMTDIMFSMCALQAGNHITILNRGCKYESNSMYIYLYEIAIKPVN